MSVSGAGSQARIRRRSPGRTCRAPGVTAHPGDDPDRHRAEHALLAGPRVGGGDRLDLVVRKNRAIRAWCAPSVPWSCSTSQSTANSCQSRIPPSATSATATRLARPQRGSTLPSAVTGTHTLMLNASSPGQEPRRARHPPDHDQTSRKSLPGIPGPDWMHHESAARASCAVWQGRQSVWSCRAGRDGWSLVTRIYNLRAFGTS